LALSFLTFAMSAQKLYDETLFTIDDEVVKVSEFVRVYNKNLDLVQDESQKDVDAYLDLYVNYKLKVKEAYKLGLDENPQYKRELRNYKKELTKRFLSENKVTDALVEEAYERLKYDVKASHILILIDEIVQDTTQVYNTILELRNRCVEEGFETVFDDLNANYKTENSQSLKYKGYDVYAEHLGYFSAFKMVYPFESTAFNTPVGEISMPVRTRFGYHILKVEDKRPNEGTVTVAHLMVSSDQKDSSLDPKKRIDDLYKKIKQGEKFDALAKQFSDDKSSASKGGMLNPFRRGQLNSVKFEEQAFALKSEGDISKPFQTNYGWHIVKLIKKEPLLPFEVMKPQLEQRIKRDSRSSLVNTALAKKLKKSYKINESENALNDFKNILNDNFYTRSWTFPKNLNQNKVLVSIEDRNLTYKDFAEHLMKSQNKYFNKKVSKASVVENEYEKFLQNQIIKYREDHLESQNPEFKQILKEYREGLLLFDLMEQKVWNKATSDTLGLQNFFKENQQNYIWNKRIQGVVFSCSNKSDLKKVAKMLKLGKKTEEIEQELNANGEHKVFTTKGIMDKTHQVLPQNFKFKKGISDIYKQNEAYHLVWVNEVLPEGYKNLEEARGKAISDYQTFIEKKWMNELHQKYKVTINNKVLEKVKSQILN